MNVRGDTPKTYLCDNERVSANVERVEPQIATIRPSVRDFDGDASMLLTVQEVAELLKVPVSWVYERTRERSPERIPGFRLGKYWRFRGADVLAWLERQRVGAKSNA